MIFKIEPICNYRTWGGDFLKKQFNSQEERIGEVFLVSCMEEADSMIEGVKMSEFYHHHPEHFGLNLKKFPLRINLIDACDDLSLQSHPKGLDEAWYILGCQDDSQLVIGTNTNDKQELISSIEEARVDKYLVKHRNRINDFVYLPSGSVHGICRGNLVFEVTYNIDITYRLYDYNRLDHKTGIKRELHTMEGVLEANLDYKFELENIKEGKIFESDNSFVIKKYICTNNLIIDIDMFYIITITRGCGRVNGQEVKLYDCFLVSRLTDKLLISGNLEMIAVSYKEEKNEEAKTIL